MKGYVLLFTLLASPAFCIADDAGPDIKVTDLGGGDYHMIISATIDMDPAGVQGAIHAAAQKQCASKLPQFGKYKFESKLKMDNDGKLTPDEKGVVIEQDLSCVDAIQQVVKPGPSDPNWKPGDADEKAVVSGSYRYFAAEDSGDYVGVYAMQSAQMRGSLADQTSITKKFNADAGAVISRKIVMVTWYKDPPDAPALGIYAAVDFVSHYQNIDIHCGYLVWYRQPDGSYQLTREETKFITKDSVQKMTPTQLANTKAMYGCAGE